MSSNKTARERLEKIFGKICFIEELGIRNIPKEQRRKIKGYTKYDDVITYHHIKERHKGGLATDENGALVRGYNHRWLHSLPEDQKEKINNCMLEFKAAVLHTTGTSLEVDSSISMPLEFTGVDCIEIPVYDNTELDNQKRQKFNRSKEKRKFRRQVEEELYYMEYNDDDDEWYR